MNSTRKFLELRDFLFRYRTNYEIAYNNFHFPEFDNFNWVIDFFDIQYKDDNNTALCIIEKNGIETKKSFSELSARSNQVANFLRFHKVKRGDRVLLILENQVELWETMLALIKIGSVIIPTTPLIAVDELIDRIERGKVKLVIVNTSQIEKFSGIKGDFTKISVGGDNKNWIDYKEFYNESPDFQPEGITKASDPMILYFTSGTTSKPKLVLHSHKSYPVGHLSTMYWLGLQPGDVHLNISSPGWAKHAWSSFFAPWNAGATVFVHNYSRFSAKETLEKITRHKVTSICAPPTVWRMIVQENLVKYKTELRELVSAGEPLNPEIIQKIYNAWNITIRDGYGQTETSAQIGNTPMQRIILGSMGRPLPGYKVDLLDTQGEKANEGEVALDLSENPIGLMLGYEDNQEQNKKVMRNGYYYTGDIAFRNDDGYITFIGRSDDIFKSSDYRISPFELESILIEHEAIAEAAVIPSPDAQRLYVPKAFIKLKEIYPADRETVLSIFEHSRAKLSPYKRIRRIEISELPKTPSGKIRRVELRTSEITRNLEIRNSQEFWEEDFPEFSK